jgi:hypothetical protein
MTVFNNSEEISELTNAMIALKSITDWKDSAQLLSDIQDKISNIQTERQRAER